MTGRWLLGLGMLSSVAVFNARDGNPSRLERSALADARQRLLERVGALQLTAEVTVEAFLAEDRRLEPVLAERLSQAEQLGQPRAYTDGTVEVDVRITLVWLVEQLGDLHRRLYHGDRVKATDFAAMTTLNVEQHLVATGSATPIAAPDRVEGQAPNPQPRPAGWQHVTDQGMVMARHAAELDAVRQLIEHVAGLDLTETLTVGEFLAVDARLQAEWITFLEQARFGDPTYTPERICTVPAKQAVEPLIARINDLRKRHARGDQVTEKDIESLRRGLNGTEIQAIGSGIAPPSYVRQPRSADARRTLPAWTWGMLRATARGEAPTAEITAHRTIAEQIDALSISGSRTVADLIREDNALRRDIATYLTAVRKIAETRETDGTTTVTVELPLERLGRIVTRRSNVP